VATSVDNLHSASVNITKQTALTEKGEVISARGDQVNMHDILTGSDPQGNYSAAGSDTTCGNWDQERRWLGHRLPSRPNWSQGYPTHELMEFFARLPQM
jgi:hypothetical protein